MSENENIRHWLRNNNYNDVADLIDEIEEEWRKAGNKTRRNWWLILSGGKDGQPKRVAGRQFPVLKAAQIRQGLKVSKTAISRNKREKRQAVWENGRWT